MSIAVGWGGVYGIMHRATDRKGPGTVYTFALGGKATLPDFVEYQQGALRRRACRTTRPTCRRAPLLYVSNCVFCHGVPGVDRGGNIPNLGYSSARRDRQPRQVRLPGPTMDDGMPDFTGKLTPEEVEKIKAFIQGTADAIRPK